MMPYQDIAMQLIDMPPLSREHVDPWVYDLIRRADLLWLVVECGNSLEGWELIQELLAPKRIVVYPAEGDSPELADPGTVAKPTILVVTACDRPECLPNVEALQELLDEEWPTLPTSTQNGLGFDDLRQRSFQALHVIRIYTKQPGHPPDMKQPFTLPEGATIEDLTTKIHRELLGQLKFARIWGKSVFDGQRVQRDHVLEEGDVVELHV
jgi:ribosome-interacting GTPase 1